MPEEQLVSLCDRTLVLKEALAKKTEALAKKTEALAKIKEELAKKTEALAKIKEELAKKTICGALRLDTVYSDKCQLVCHVNDTSHRGSHTFVPSDDRQFHIHQVPFTEANTRASQLMAKIESCDFSYINEYDVQGWTHAALGDAVTICNTLLSTLGSTDGSIELHLRRESHLDSNLLDHAVVYEVMSGLPIFELETKKPVKELLNDNSLGVVKGQVHTQLSAMTAFGHPNPFGAITTFNETRIVWIENDHTRRVLCQHRGGLEDLVGAVQGISPTQSTFRRSQRVTSNAGYTFDESSRSLAMSQALKMHEMIPAFVNGILCALVGFHKTKAALVELKKGYLLNKRVIRMDGKTLVPGMLNITCSGNPAQAPSLAGRLAGESHTFFLTEFLGSGLTSKAFRAVTENGDECVVKSFVRRYNDNHQLIPTKEFQNMAKEFVKREVRNFHIVYPELQNNGFWCKLKNDLFCVVHPFFQHIQHRTTEHARKVREHLKQRFTAKNLMFKHTDRAWRHVGTLHEKIFLFDLADIESFDKGSSDEDKETYLNQHYQHLEAHLSRDHGEAAF